MNIEKDICKKMESIPFFYSFDLFTGRLTLRDAISIPDEIFEFWEYIYILDASG